MEVNLASQLLSLNESYKTWVIETTKLKISASKKLLDKFSTIRSIELDKLPYRLNLLDDLSTNENAHSKFLIRLLQYKPALIDFLAFINDSDHNFNFNIELIVQPTLTWEKFRIDGLIKETNKYVIIIENKIHNAVEQNHQVGRYIEKCKSLGYKVEQIFILYLTKTENDFQSDQSWGQFYKLDDFQTRYSKLSYRSHILPWLIKYLAVLGTKEDLIKSAIVQYIDHLKHFFNNKEIYSSMNEELQRFLSQELGLKLDKAENIELVNNKIEELNELSTRLKELAKSSKYELFEEWKKKIIEQNELDHSKVFFYEDSTYIKTGVILEFQGQPFSVLIENNSRSTYFGFGRHSSSDLLNEEVRAFLKNLVVEESMKPEEPWWYGWKYTNLSDAFGDFDILLKTVLSNLKTTK